MLPNLTALRAFEAAARLESFAGAAVELSVTPAAVSRAVRRLEDDLGFALFHRAHRAVSLTDAGARYAQRVTEGFSQLAAEIPDVKSNSSRLTIDVEATFLRQWLLPRFRENSFKRLNVTLNIRTHHDPPRVISAIADLAIVWGFADYNGFKRKRLVSPKTILVAAPDLQISYLADVAGKGLIHEANDQWWKLVYAEANMPYPVDTQDLTLNRCDLPVEAARLGLGTAVADDVIAENELKAGTLIQIAGPRLDSQDYFLMSRLNNSVPAREFANWLVEQAADFAEWQAQI